MPAWVVDDRFWARALAIPGRGPGVALGLVGGFSPFLPEGLVLAVSGGGWPAWCVLVLHAGVCVARGARAFSRVMCVCGVCVGVGVGTAWMAGFALRVCGCSVSVVGSLGACPRLPRLGLAVGVDESLAIPG